MTVRVPTSDGNPGNRISGASSQNLPDSTFHMPACKGCSTGDNRHHGAGPRVRSSPFPGEQYSPLAEPGRGSRRSGAFPLTRASVSESHFPIHQPFGCPRSIRDRKEGRQRQWPQQRSLTFSYRSAPLCKPCGHGYFVSPCSRSILLKPIPSPISISTS